MKVLGIDPGTGRMGWAIVEGNHARQSLVACGCAETKANGDPALRLVELYRSIEKVIEEHKPEAAAVEDLFFFKNAKTVIGVAEARGMVVTLCGLQDLAVYDYTPLQVKQTITGYGRAEKQQVQLMVRTMLKMKETIKPDDAADAVAVGLTHLIFNQVLRGK
jgi:crossover junction endodeoxyribonuclease RuvC